MKRTKLELAVLYILSIIIALCAALPFVWVLLTALKSPEQIFNASQIIPTYITFDNFKQVLFHSNFARYFLNSAAISIAVTLISMIFAVMAAYGFCRYHIMGSERIKMGILFTKMFPGVLLSIPYYVIMKKMGLIDTHLGLVIINCSFVLPFAVWNMCTFFAQMPWEIEEAALVDGCNRFQAFTRVIFPLAKPGISATTLYCFLMSWDEFMYANTFINTAVKKTVQVGIRDYIGEYSTEWGPLMAAVILSLIPVIVFFVFVQDNLVGGLSAGAVKG
ncbi:carbohydrate ABC transporter permease [Clostridium sp. AF32-12BH]|uniref:carbohydrate ABC transporter permease n=1 Tax=Clostridium sp. AF32-12BH TaxID=2292006 RepID=UPI000E508C8E|nr:carbohydrate ABC transporter permease [Clostridium sp. AF32-12BH]RHP48536.1 carbohydrate ABC transporter permease [Clostridium sp. AF32-12BH]